MSKYQIDFDVPDGYRVIEYRPNGIPYEERGLYLYCYLGHKTVYQGWCTQPCLILEKAWIKPEWTPPSCVKDGFFAMDRNGAWCWYEAFPRAGCTMWNGAGDYTYLDSLTWIDFGLPEIPTEHWKESLYEVKHD